MNDTEAIKRVLGWAELAIGQQPSGAVEPEDYQALERVALLVKLVGKVTTDSDFIAAVVEACREREMMPMGFVKVSNVMVWLEEHCKGPTGAKHIAMKVKEGQRWEVVRAAVKELWAVDDGWFPPDDQKKLWWGLCDNVLAHCGKAMVTAAGLEWKP